MGELSLAVLYLFEKNVVHDDHWRQVGVGAPHHSQLGGLRAWRGSLRLRSGCPRILLHWRARWVLRVGYVHGAHVFGAHICQAGVETMYNYLKKKQKKRLNITMIIALAHWKLNDAAWVRCTKLACLHPKQVSKTSCKQPHTTYGKVYLVAFRLWKRKLFLQREKLRARVFIN